MCPVQNVNNVPVHSLPLGALAVASAMARPVLLAGVVIAALKGTALRAGTDGMRRPTAASLDYRFTLPGLTEGGNTL
jgi:hypothetical protein